MHFTKAIAITMLGGSLFGCATQHGAAAPGLTCVEHVFDRDDGYITVPFKNYRISKEGDEVCAQRSVRDGSCVVWENVPEFIKATTGVQEPLKVSSTLVNELTYPSLNNLTSTNPAISFPPETVIIGYLVEGRQHSRGTSQVCRRDN